MEVDPLPNTALPLADLCEDIEAKRDGKFLDNLQVLLENQSTSKLLIPYISQLKVVNKKARRSLKKRIEQHKKR